MKSTLYAFFALMLAAFATLGALSVSETKVLREQLSVAGASSDAIGALRELEQEMEAFLRGDGDTEIGSVKERIADLIRQEALALQHLAKETQLPEQSRRLLAAADSLVDVERRVTAIAAARPIKNAAEARVLHGASAIIEAVGAANTKASNVTLDFEGDRAVYEGPFKRLARMSRLLGQIDEELSAIAASVRSSDLEAARGPDRLNRLRRHISRLRFQTPIEARPAQARLEKATAFLIGWLTSQKSGALGKAEMRAFEGRLAALSQAADALRSAAVDSTPEAADGLERINEIDQSVAWMNLEFGRAAINANALGLAAERFTASPSREALASMRRFLNALRLRLDSATKSAQEFETILEAVSRVRRSATDIEGALDTVLRLNQEEERFRRDAIALVENIETAAIEVVRQIEQDATARSERAAALVAGALGLGGAAWLFGLFLTRNRLLLPFRGLTRAMERLAEGDLTAASEGEQRHDEIGAMARAMEVFRGNALKVRNLQAEREKQELAQRAQIEALLQGIKVLNDAETIPVMFDGVLGTLSRLVEFDEAAILVDNGSGRFVALATTNARFRPEIEPPEIACEEGRAMEDCALLEDADYRIASPIKGLGFRSALLAPLNAHSRRAMMICARREKGLYDEKDLSAVKAFTPVAEQAVHNAEQLDELETAVRDLDAMAHHDALTGLKNRKSFMNEIGIYKEQVEREEDPCFALFQIDLDHFKVINDALGHAAGDYALTWAADVIRRCVGENDVVARLGGDEFAVIVPEPTDGDKGLSKTAQLIVNELSKPFDYDGRSLQMGASVGIGRFPADSDDPDEIMNIADMALLEAKAGGRGQCAFFSVALRRELDRRQSMEFKLLDALASGELELWYQPIVSLKSHKVECFEALVRWRNSSFGLTLPGDFLPVAERAGLMGKIGEWVMRSALFDLGPWLKESENRRVAVNVAGVQLCSTDFVPVLDGIVREFDLRPSALELELSEEITLRRSAELALDNLMALYERGYQIAFDDFGTGYTSLAHLRQFPGQRMKIDRSFVSGCGGLEENDADAALTRGLFGLAKSLGMEVVAEGVETAAQLAFCQEIGCEEVQGYLLGKAMPVKEALSRAAQIDRPDFALWLPSGGQEGSLAANS